MVHGGGVEKYKCASQVFVSEVGVPTGYHRTQALTTPLTMRTLYLLRAVWTGCAIVANPGIITLALAKRALAVPVAVVWAGLELTHRVRAVGEASVARRRPCLLAVALAPRLLMVQLLSGGRVRVCVRMTDSLANQLQASTSASAPASRAPRRWRCTWRQHECCSHCHTHW